MISEKYVWFAWTIALLVPWLSLYVSYVRFRKVMLWASVFTMPFGLTEPLFVPRYWNPPSLFDLAQRTGFDIESFIFSFAIAGVGAILYNIVTKQDLQPIGPRQREGQSHRLHRIYLSLPIVLFPIIYFLPWNPIYPGIVAMVLGAVATVACRPDLRAKTLIGGGLFAAYYAVFMLLLNWSAPGYIGRVWNLPDLSGIVVAGIPIEELVFGFAFGMYWSGIFEHLTWQRLSNVERLRAQIANTPS